MARADGSFQRARLFQPSKPCRNPVAVAPEKPCWQKVTPVESDEVCILVADCLCNDLE